MNEIWKDIKGYEGAYQISSLGNVRSIRFNKVIPKLPHKTKSSYFRITLHKDNKRKNYQVHRLVAENFIGPAPYGQSIVNHKNHIRDMNSVENLEWASYLENNTRIDTNWCIQYLENRGYKITPPV